MHGKAVALVQAHGHDPGSRADHCQRTTNAHHQGIQRPLIEAQLRVGHQRGGLHRHVIHHPGSDPQHHIHGGRVHHLEQAGDIGQPTDMVEAGHRGDDADKEQQGVPLHLLQLILPGQFDAAMHQQPGVQGDEAQGDTHGEFDADLEHHVTQHRTSHRHQPDQGQAGTTGLERGFADIRLLDQVFAAELAQVEQVQGGGKQQPADQRRRNQQQQAGHADLARQYHHQAGGGTEKPHPGIGGHHDIAQGHMGITRVVGDALDRLAEDHRRGDVVEKG